MSSRGPKSPSASAGPAGSDSLDPLSVFPNGFGRDPIAGVAEVPESLEQPAFFQAAARVAHANGDVLKDAGITITIDHASGATVADQLGFVEVVDGAHGGFPVMASVKVQVPIQIEILVTSETAEALGFPFQVPLHLVQGFGGIHDGESAASLEFFDSGTEVGQAAVPFVAEDVVGIDRHNDAAEAVICQGPHGIVRPERAVRADHGVNA